MPSTRVVYPSRPLAAGGRRNIDRSLVAPGVAACSGLGRVQGDRLVRVWQPLKIRSRWLSTACFATPVPDLAAIGCPGRHRTGARNTGYCDRYRSGILCHSPETACSQSVPHSSQLRLRFLPMVIAAARVAPVLVVISNYRRSGAAPFDDFRPVPVVFPAIPMVVCVVVACWPRARAGTARPAAQRGPRPTAALPDAAVLAAAPGDDAPSCRRGHRLWEGGIELGVPHRLGRPSPAQQPASRRLIGER